MQSEEKISKNVILDYCTIFPFLAYYGLKVLKTNLLNNLYNFTENFVLICKVSFFKKRYDMSFLAAVAAGGTDLDLQTALEFTSDFAFLEMIHRLIVCVFEALCLHRSTGSHPGGATPGKLILGLRVVSCAQVDVTDIIIFL